MISTTDGTQWMPVSARALSQVPIWKGNRVLDAEHAKRIHNSLKGEVYRLSMNPFRVVDVQLDDGATVRYLIDGQHRLTVLQDYFRDLSAQDFTVLVAMNYANNEDEVIDLFKRLNSTKSITWSEDPVLAANKYMEALMKHFNKNAKRPLIRTGTTKRPYLSADKLRDALVAKKVEQWKRTPDEFVEHAINQNHRLLQQLQPCCAMEVDALKYQFALGLDTSFQWV